MDVDDVCAARADLRGLADTAAVLVAIAPLCGGVDWSEGCDRKIEVEVQRLRGIERARAGGAREDAIRKADAATTPVVPRVRHVQRLALVVNIHVLAHVVFRTKLHAQSAIYRAKPDGVLIALKHVPFPVERRRCSAAVITETCNERSGCGGARDFETDVADFQRHG